MNKGKLYLIPSPLGENNPEEVIPAPVLDSLTGFRTFVVEEVRTARRYLSRAGLKGKMIVGCRNTDRRDTRALVRQQMHCRTSVDGHFGIGIQGVIH